MTRLSKRFPSCKNHLLSPSKISSQPAPSSSPSFLKNPGVLGRRRRRGGERRHCMGKSTSVWSVYLIASTRVPRTYVGVTTNFFYRDFRWRFPPCPFRWHQVDRLKQHNGEIKGGAKASSAGRPWSLACIIQGFKDRSEACKFEAKWKSLSRRISRKKDKDCPPINLLLQQREAALIQATASFDCNYLRIEWCMKP